MRKINKGLILKYLLLVVIIFGLGIGSGIIIQRYNQPKVFPLASQPNPLDLPIPQSWKSVENQPSNSFATAIDLVPGYDTQGTLGPGNILDYYKFTIKQPAKVQMTVSNLPQEFNSVYYDANYNEIGHTLRTGSISGVTVISLQNPGKYYVKIFGNYTDVVNLPYTIRVSILPFFE